MKLGGMAAALLRIGLLALGLLGFCGWAFALPCTLTQEDLDALSRPACGKNVSNCGPITGADIEQLPSERQLDLCLGRKFYETVHDRLAKGDKPEEIASHMTTDDLPSGLSRYLTKQEYDEMRDVIAILMANAMSHQ